MKKIEFLYITLTILVVTLMVSCTRSPAVKSISLPGYSIDNKKVLLLFIVDDNTEENLDNLDSILIDQGKDYNISFAKDSYTCDKRDNTCQSIIYEKCKNDVVLKMYVTEYSGNGYETYGIKYSTTIFDCSLKKNTWKSLTNIQTSMNYKSKFIQALLRDAYNKNIISRRIDSE